MSNIFSFATFCTNLCLLYYCSLWYCEKLWMMGTLHLKGFCWLYSGISVKIPMVKIQFALKLSKYLFVLLCTQSPTPLGRSSWVKILPKAQFCVTKIRSLFPFPWINLEQKKLSLKIVFKHFIFYAPNWLWLEQQEVRYFGFFVWC